MAPQGSGTVAGSLTGEEIVALTKRHTIFEWSAQAKVDPIPVAGNGVPPGGTLPAGEPAKTVVGGRLPGETR